MFGQTATTTPATATWTTVAAIAGIYDPVPLYPRPVIRTASLAAIACATPDIIEIAILVDAQTSLAALACRTPSLAAVTLTTARVINLAITDPGG